jgi:hypothetical protein
MFTVIEEVDGSFYAESVFTPQEILRLKRGESIEAQTIFKRRKWYVSARLQGDWDEETISSET